MSQVPTPVAEPPAAPTGAQGTSAGAGQPAVDAAALQQKLTELQAENQTLQTYKGWQAEFTRGKQSGVYDFLMDAAKEGGPKALHEKWREVQSLKSEVEQLGGLEKVREATKFYGEVLGDGATPANPPQGGTPAQAQPPVGLTREDILGLVRDTMAQSEQKTQINDAYSGVAGEVLGALGLADADEAAEARCRALLRYEAEQLAKGRELTVEDIAAAAPSVQQFLGNLRASGAQVAQGQDARQPTTPPAMNGPGPGGQPPKRTLAEMSDDEVNQVIREKAEKVMGPTQPASREGMPDNWKWTT